MYLCICGKDVESIEHFLLHSPQFVDKRRGTLLSALSNFSYCLLGNTSNVLTQTLLFGNMSLSLSDDSEILSATFDFILSSKNLMNSFFK